MTLRSGSLRAVGLLAALVVASLSVAAQPEIELTPPTATPSFGRSVDLKTNYAVVGASNAAGGRGAAYVYRYDEATGWTLDAELLAPGGVAGDQFGAAVAIGANSRVAVGAPAAGPANTDGTVYVFRRTGPGAWAFEASFTAKELGRSLAFDETTLVATEGLTAGSSRVRVWRRTGTTWASVCTLSDSRDRIGEVSVSLPYGAHTSFDTPNRGGDLTRVFSTTNCQRLTDFSGVSPSLDEERIAYTVDWSRRNEPFTNLVIRPNLLSPSTEVVYTAGEGEAPPWGARWIAYRRGYIAAVTTSSTQGDLFVFREDSTGTRGWGVFRRVYPANHLTGPVAVSGRFVLAGAQGRAYLLDLAALGYRDQPLLYTPADDAADQATPLAFAWGALDYAQSYTLEVDNDSLFGSPALREDGLLDTTLVVENGLASGQTFYWRVRGEQISEVGPWSRTRSFTMATTRPPATPVLSSPADNAQNQPLSLTLQWASSRRAVSYNVQLATEPTFAVPMLDAETTTLSRAVSGLVRGVTYYWRVRSRNAAGFSDWSPIRQFRTLPAPPVVPIPITPANGTTGVSRTPLFVWGGPSQSATYTLQASRSATFNNLVVNVTVSDTTYQVTTLLATNRQHYWRVRAQNGAGTSAWSAVSSFSTGTALTKDDGLPTVFALSEPQPNPSSGAVTFRLDVPEAAAVRLAVFDALGREVAVLLDGEVAAGRHPVMLDASALPAGVYVARLSAGTIVQTRRLTVAR